MLDSGPRGSLYHNVAFSIYHTFLSGLSLYQGGPAMFLSDWNGEGEHYDQLEAGLKRTGLDQVCRINFSHN